MLGGTSSSRLFQEVRERRGLAYSVYSFQSLFADTGQIGLYVGTRPDNVGRRWRSSPTELERFREDAGGEGDAEELDRSKENVKGRIVLSLESTAARMNRLGSSVLAELPLLTVDEVVERIDAVTARRRARAGRRAVRPRAAERRRRSAPTRRPSARARAGRPRAG